MHANLILDPIFYPVLDSFFNTPECIISFQGSIQCSHSDLCFHGSFYQNKYLRLNLLSGWFLSL